jgi:hypothetical protein
MMETRVGEQTLCEYKLLNRTPMAASRSMFGVRYQSLSGWRCGFPGFIGQHRGRRVHQSHVIDEKEDNVRPVGFSESAFAWCQCPYHHDGGKACHQCR